MALSDPCTHTERHVTGTKEVRIVDELHANEVDWRVDAVDLVFTQHVGVFVSGARWGLILLIVVIGVWLQSESDRRASRCVPWLVCVHTNFTDPGRDGEYTGKRVD